MTMRSCSRNFDKDLLLPLAWAGLFICVIFTAAVRTDLYGQRWLAVFVLVCLLVMRRLPLGDIGRIIFLLLGTYLTEIQAPQELARSITEITSNKWFVLAA